MEQLVSDNSQVKVESSTDTANNNNASGSEASIDNNKRPRKSFRGDGKNFRGGRGGKNHFRRRGEPNNEQQPQDENFTEGRGHKNHPRRPDEVFNERVAQLSGNTYDLPPIEVVEKKFSGRNRIFIGNIGAEITEQEIEELFKKYGECSEIFINKEKNFGFIKLDYHCNAEKAIKELDGTVLKNRTLKVRCAPNTTSIRVKNLTPMVTNELLYYAFSIFGEVEKATICVDERGKPIGEGIVDFARKGSALAAIRKCTESCFFITTALRPCIVEPYEVLDYSNGFSDKDIRNKRNVEYQTEREQGPRFASEGSFEEEYGRRWKKLYEMHAHKLDALKLELKLEIDKLSAQMEYARYEHETEMLRKALKEREMNKEKQKREWEMKQKMVEQERLRSEEMMKMCQSDIWTRRQKEDSRRREDEMNLFIQAQNLDSMLEYQENNSKWSDAPADYEERGRQQDPSDCNAFDRSGMSRRSNEDVWVNESNQRSKRRRF